MAHASTTSASPTSTPVSTPIWRLLRTFSWQELRHHGVRHSTAMLAVLLGVALAFSVHLINESALSEFASAVRTVSGQADLSLHAAHGGLDESIYPIVAKHPDIKVASPMIEVQTQIDGKPLRILGIDALVAGPLSPAVMPQAAKDVIGADRLMLFSPYVIFLNTTAQHSLGVVPGDNIELKAGLKAISLRVMGSVAASGDALGVMDIAGAQDAFGMNGQLSRLDIKLAPGAQAKDVLASLHLPAGVLSDSTEESVQRVSNVSRAYRVNLTVLALVALFTGAFLVFSILSLSVAKRQQQFALLGVLGLSAKERLQLVLLESAVIGVIGSALGIAAGTGLAAAALHVLAGDLGGGYFPGIAPQLQWSGWAALVYGGLGVGAAVWGGLLPAREAQALTPAQALKGLGHADRGMLPLWSGPLLLLIGVGLAQLPPVFDMPFFAYISVACLLTGGIACVPGAVGGALNVLMKLLPRYVLARNAPLVLSLERARHMRQTATVAIAGVVASLSLSVALTVMVSSFRGSVTAWLDAILPADLYVRSSKGATANNVTTASDTLHFDQGMLDAIKAVPGVTRTMGIRVSSLAMRADQPAVALITRPLTAASGDADVEHKLPVVGAVLPPDKSHIGIFVSEQMVSLYGARQGTLLRLPMRADQAPVEAYVRGVWRDYARQQGAIIIDENDYKRLTGDTDITDLALWLAPEAKTPDVQEGIRQVALDRNLDGNLLTFTEPRDIRTSTLRIFDRSFAVTYWLQAIAIAIGLFGTSASFSAQVLARRKEFGLLSHLGFTHKQILRVVAGEGAVLTSVGAILGLALGIGVSLVLVYVVNPQSFHWTMDVILPWPRLLALCGAVVAAGTFTAWTAGGAAAGKDAVMAVKEDW